MGFISLGCPKNLVDSEVMMGLLDRAGARLTTHPEVAEILVVNTCSFIDTAKQESVDTILEMARHKTLGRAKKLIVAGCLVERYRDEIMKNIPEVDAVVGTGELESILEAAGIAPAPAPAPSPFTILTSAHADARPGQESQAGTHKPSLKGTGLKGTGFSPYISGPKTAGALAPEASQPTSRPEGDHRERHGRFRRDEWAGASSSLPTYLYDEKTPRVLSTPRASAYIKIAEGCDHPCSFCVIPNLRGKFRSRRFESVLAEAQLLVARGVEEITLIGQDTTCYGEDLGLKDGLATLLDTLACIEGLRWLRFLYAYPNRITSKLLDTIARHDNICKYLDLPLQHASPAVLKRMKRGAGAEIFLGTLEKVRAAVPGVALRTSFIVGFPGESLRDFEILEQFIGKARFDGSASFPLRRRRLRRARARRQGAEARHGIRGARRLMKLQQSISRRAKQMVGRELLLLAEGGKRRNPAPLGRPHPVPGASSTAKSTSTTSARSPRSSPAAAAQITEAHDYDLVARIVSRAT